MPRRIVAIFASLVIGAAVVTTLATGVAAADPPLPLPNPLGPAAPSVEPPPTEGGSTGRPSEGSASGNGPTAQTPHGEASSAEVPPEDDPQAQAPEDDDAAPQASAEDDPSAQGPHGEASSTELSPGQKGGGRRAATHDWPSEIVALTNNERVDVGCPELTVDPRLTAAAQKHSKDMASRKQMSHLGGDGSSFDERIRAEGYPNPGAENVAYGYPDPATTVHEWMVSPGHRRNIVNCAYVTIGVGFDPRGNYVTQDFGRPESDGAQQSPS